MLNQCLYERDWLLAGWCLHSRVNKKTNKQTIANRILLKVTKGKIAGQGSCYCNGSIKRLPWSSGWTVGLAITRLWVRIQPLTCVVEWKDWTTCNLKAVGLNPKANR